MEHLGVGVDVEVLRAEPVVHRGRGRAQKIIELAGREFNVNSTPQLREVLFDEPGLTPQKKTKTGYSTDQATLEKLRGEHPIIDHLLRYREVEKLRSTYGEGLLAEVAPDGRIHATFNQTVARTGRLSSDAPNLHNIPVRSDEGRRFREAFVRGGTSCSWRTTTDRAAGDRPPRSGPGLIGAFTAGRTSTRYRLADLPVSPGRSPTSSAEGEDDLRHAYGMEGYDSASGSASRLRGAGDPRRVLSPFPAVREFMERTVAGANDYTETVFDRRRHPGCPPASATCAWRGAAGDERPDQKPPPTSSGGAGAPPPLFEERDLKSRSSRCTTR